MHNFWIATCIFAADFILGIALGYLFSPRTADLEAARESARYWMAAYKKLAASLERQRAKNGKFAKRGSE